MSLIHKILLLVLCAYILVIIPSCVDNNCNPQEVRQIQRDWGYFAEGSYWIYQEETNGYEDSFWVFKDTSFFTSIESGSYDKPCHQIVNSYVTNLNTQDTFFLAINTFTYFVNLITYLNDFSEYGEHSALTPTLPPKQGERIQQGPPGQFTVFDSVYSSYILNGDTFQDVVRANNNMNMAFQGTPTIFYYAKHVGLIQKDFPDYDLSWRLVRYKIEQ